MKPISPIEGSSQLSRPTGRTNITETEEKKPKEIEKKRITVPEEFQVDPEELIIPENVVKDILALAAGIVPTSEEDSFKEPHIDFQG